MKKFWIPFVFCIMAGLAIALMAISGHTRIAAFAFPSLIVIGAFLFFALRRTRVIEVDRTENNEGKSNKIFRFFGWILLGGVLLQVLLQMQKTLFDHQQFRPELIIEYVIELAIAYFLMRPGRSRNS